MLMKVLYVVLALSIVAIIGAVVALLWRLRWHLGRPHVTPPDPMLETPLLETPPDRDPSEKA